MDYSCSAAIVLWVVSLTVGSNIYFRSVQIVDGGSKCIPQQPTTGPEAVLVSALLLILQL